MAEYLARPLIGYLSPPWPTWLGNATAGVAHCAILLAVVMLSVAIFHWMERKVSGRIQDRLGPSRVGGRFGWLQPVADGLKLLCKEDLIPKAADGPLFRLAPYLAFCPAFCVFLALPLADGWVAQRLNVAVFFILAVGGPEIFGVILGGYSSGSKWSLLGAMREAVQVAGCQIPLGLCVLIIVMIAGTMDLVTIGNMQQGFFWNWFLFHDPFTFVAFWVFLTCAVGRVRRAPFDLPEAESELVAGFLTEYSGFRWSAFVMAQYGSMLAVSMVAAILFLGAWNGPVPIAGLLGMTPQTHALAGWLGSLLGACNLIFKGFVGVAFMMWLRWTLPRLRIDQVLTTCLKYCLPLAAAMFLGAMLWTLAIPGGLIPRTQSLGEVPEGPYGVATADDEITRP